MTALAQWELCPGVEPGHPDKPLSHPHLHPAGPAQHFLDAVPLLLPLCSIHTSQNKTQALHRLLKHFLNTTYLQHSKCFHEIPSTWLGAPLVLLFNLAALSRLGSLLSGSLFFS